MWMGQAGVGRAQNDRGPAANSRRALSERLSEFAQACHLLCLGSAGTVRAVGLALASLPTDIARTMTEPARRAVWSAISMWVAVVMECGSGELTRDNTKIPAGSQVGCLVGMT